MDTNLLTLGGVGAAVAAGWSQIRTLFSYVSNLVLVSHDLNPLMTDLIHRELRTYWRPLPGTATTFRHDWLKTQPTSLAECVVPFEIPSGKTFYRQEWKLLYVNVKGSGSHITYIRGTVNIKSILQRLITEYNKDTHESETNLDRYRIIQIQGSDKNAYDRASFNSSNSNNPSPAPSLVGESLTTYWTDPRFDRSFMFPDSPWLSRTDQDPFEHLYYNEEIETYIQQAQTWLKKAQWYKERMIPWRRGWMLYGEPGTGKTSLACAVAGKLKIPLYQFQLNTLSDSEFINEWSGMHTPCIALLEDLDTSFCLRESITAHKSLSFNTVLNAISGTMSRDGVFLMASTNDLSKIDPAMAAPTDSNVASRPGRVDQLIKVSYMDLRGRQKMAQRILRDWPTLVSEVVNKHTQVTPAQFQELCVELALTLLQKEEANEKTTVRTVVLAQVENQSVSA